MHISEGVLTTPVLIGGAAVALTGLTVSLKKLDVADIPKTAMLSGAFFVASLIHVPIGPSNVHLVLTGLMGLLLGWAAVPAIVVALLLQAILFQFGGLTTLGVNTVIMGLPALLAHLLCGRALSSENRLLAVGCGAAAGGAAILLGALLLALALAAGGESFTATAKLAFAAHIPLVFAEAVLTGFIVAFIRRVKPDMLKPESAHVN